MLIDGLANRAHRAVAYYSQRGADIHFRHKTISRRARAIDSLVGEADAL